jgi:hypothetical protein
MKAREPVVAGRFYPSEKGSLRRMIEGFTKGAPAQKRKVIGVVSPHAGYVYSGPVAGVLFANIAIPEEALILSPNHTGLGPPFALWPQVPWLTPLGEVSISLELHQLILGSSGLLKQDTLAQSSEHAAEVQLPFLQYFNPDIKITVLTISLPYANMDKTLASFQGFGLALGTALKGYKKGLLLVASSDMNHYESHQITKQKDAKAIEQMERLDERGLLETVTKHNIGMCGLAPVIVMIAASKVLGATSGHLIKYATSGETSGDYEQVVGYAAVVVS